MGAQASCQIFGVNCPRPRPPPPPAPTTGAPTEPPTSSPTLSPTAAPTPAPTSIVDDPSAADVSCPDTGTVVVIPNGGLLTIRRSDPDVLCLLTLVDNSNNNNPRAPVARSYQGEAWEVYSNDFGLLLEPSCDAAACVLDLPQVSGSFQLQSTTYTPASSLDPYARFLEQATFGATYDEIAAVEASNSHGNDGSVVAMARWLQHQQDVEPPSYHRAFFRQHLNARFAASTAMGQVSHPCAVGTLYRRFAFTEKDEINTVVVSTTPIGNRRVVTVNNAVRSVYTAIEIGPSDSTTKTNLPDGSYNFCEPPVPSLGGLLAITGPNGCEDLYFDGVFGNPPVSLPPGAVGPGGGVNQLLILDLEHHVVDAAVLNDFTGDVQRVERPVDDEVCAAIVLTNGNAPVVFGELGADLFIYDPRFEIHDNTASTPLLDGGGALVQATVGGNPDTAVLCSNVARTPFNEDSCFLSTEPSACTVREVPSTPVRLVRSTLRAFYRDSGRTRYVYAVSGLNITADRTVALPCTPDARSRWIPLENKTADTCGRDNGVDDTTANLFVTLLDANTDNNPNVRDVVFPNARNFECRQPGRTAFEVYSTSAEICWLNVHPDHLQVYDMTVWTVLHPGGGDRITQFAQNREIVLEFPYSTFHGMDRWNSNKGRFYNLGRLGDTVDYRDLPAELQILAIDDEADSSDTAFTSGVVVCGGTEGEVANRPELGGGSYEEGAFDVFADERNATTSNGRLQSQAKLVWTSVVLGGSDQLRQRVAWALSQIFAISPDDVGGRGSVEQYLAFYDIFVRNAFTNYRDVMREVAYSVPMAIMLTFHGSRSTAFEWRRSPGNLLFPDENFAREIMQLFSIGLYELNSDGTIKTNARGRSIRSYSNDEIVEYARVWTGFTSQARRGNTEFSTRNRIDPMRIRPEWRDKFPKSGLGRKYIGEGYPLCIDLPSGHFLRRGAKFRLLGQGLPEYREFPSDWISDPERLDIELAVDDIEGSLYNKLCNPSDPLDLSSCSYPATVTLVEDIPCVTDDGRVECSVPNLDVVKLPSGVYYEYVRQPCVYQTFYDSPRKIKQPASRGGRNFMCADPRAQVASIACCANRTGNAYVSEQAWGQNTDLARAEETCTTFPTDGGVPGGLCTRQNFRIQNCGDGSRCDLASFYWTSRDCDLLVKIDTDLKVAVVHQTDDPRLDRLVDYVQEDTRTFFRVDWASDADVMTVLDTCDSTAGCSTGFDQFCICRTTTVESAAFAVSIPDLGGMPSVDQVLSLTVGALEPDVHFGLSSYSQGTVDGVSVFYQGQIDENSIFRVVDDTGRVHWRKNLVSLVLLGDEFVAAFRNPVQFFSLVDEDGERRDAEHETEAALDQYFYHPNVGPFVGYRLAQRFGISNPSPRYVKAIADAFRSGLYTLEEAGEQVVFGTNEYGDMKATIAAILLDREARDILLDADPAHGSLREPLLKVIGLMRSFEFVAADKAPFPYLRNMERRIGQMVHELPSVFSFFLPEYQPDGVVAAAGLVSPEAEAYSVPNLVGTINGLNSLVKYGLDRCFGGFGEGSTNRMCRQRVAGEFEGSSGQLTHEPSPAAANSAVTVAQELATLATGGRLSESTRQRIQQIYDAELDKTRAVIQMMQIIVSSPEFHATGLVTKSGALRPSLPVFMPSPGIPYKAVVFLLLRGGYDSFNLIVPDSGCTRTNAAGMNLRAQYEQVRGVLAFDDDERSRVIDFGEETNQACRHWAVHPAMSLLPELWEDDDGGLAWFLNMGVLNDASTNKNNFADVTETQLFAHNSMQEESQRLDPWNLNMRTGICGRAAAALDRRGFRSGAISIERPSVAVNGGLEGPIPATIGNQGPEQILNRPNRESFDPAVDILAVNQAHDDSSSIFGETFAATLTKAFQETAFFENALASAEPYLSEPESNGEENMGIITQLMQTRESRGVNRDFFFVQKTRWDHHNALKMNQQLRFTELNSDLRLFVNELRDKGLWDKVTLVVASDFARTLTPNSNEGSDHAWGGHYFVMGGSVKKGAVLGNYPEDITPDGPLTLQRGRIVPTQAWESMWHPVFHWMGMDPAEDLDEIMPNAIRSGTPLYDKDDVFKPNT